MSTLVERLQAAAAEAIANEAPELSREPKRLRGVVLEFKLRPNGTSTSTAVVEATCYVERQAVIPRGSVD